MLLWLISFIASGVVIILFIALKALQHRYDILIFWPETRERIERKLQKRKHMIDHSIAQVSVKNIYIFLYYCIVRAKKIVMLLQKWLDKKSYRLVNLIRGRQRLELRQSASHYLHDIASFKDRFRKK